MKLVPLHDRIVVERLEAPDKTPGGLFIPDAAKERPRKGKIVAVGKGRLTESGTRQEMSVAVGDVVLFNAYAGSEHEEEGKKLIVMLESDVLAVLK